MGFSARAIRRLRAIARGDEPLVRLQPLRTKKGQRKPGSLKGKLKVGREFFEPLPEEELKSWE